MNISRIIILLLCCSTRGLYAQEKQKTLTKDELKDKIKGGWAGQTIGVTFGGPTEFRFNGTFIQDYQPITWYDGYLKRTMINGADLYDDIYMDFTFVDVFDRLGLDAPVDSLANAFAYADYNLWHANQAARHNILHGIRPPESGFWKNNPHADDIDFQIEADFSGLMNPGMPNSAAKIGDKVGHIMNYGDGWYGGIFVGALYSEAFVSNDINEIVNKAITIIPKESQFYKCVNDVITWHNKYPKDWKSTWFEIQKKWSEDIGCPEGTFSPLDIDAKINAAYIVLGLLYGEGDFSKTLEIATRAGQDSDCNPSSAGGILGAMLGYKHIPDFWKMGLSEIENMDFKYTTMSLNKAYDISFKHAMTMIKNNGGSIGDKTVTINLQTPEPVRFEKSFEGLFPKEKTTLKKEDDSSEINFQFTGTGFALRGVAIKHTPELPDYDIKASLFIDGKKVETTSLSTSFKTRRYELFWTYELPNKKHTVKIVILNPSPDYDLQPWEYLVYSDTPVTATQNFIKH